MNRILFPLLLAGLVLFQTAAQAAPKVVPAAPSIAGESYILQDFDSGHILASEKPDQQVEPASLTKLMTAYVVFDEIRSGHISLDDTIQISEKSWRTPGSRMFIEVGSQVTVEELLKGMIIQSGNDASVALAEFVAGSEDAFAALMNEYARELGLDSTHFVNATGLPDPEHYTTARDLARLTRALIRQFPSHYDWYSIKEYTYNGITQYNRNKLLWRDESVDGVKTGHTESAGYCLVSSALREDMRLVSVVMGTSGENARARESQKLLNWGFRFYETHLLYEAGDPLKNMRIWKGEREDLALGLLDDLYVTVPRGRYDELKASVTVDTQIVAPAQKGQRFGDVHVRLGEQTLARRPLVALRDVKEGGLWEQMVDGVLLWFQ